MLSAFRSGALLCALALTSLQAHAGGVALGATRIVYPQGSAQVSLPVNNTDDKARFLIQSWVEDSSGKKSSDFSVTPPLFAIEPEKENTLRISYTSPRALPTDRETLYWFNSKAIPQSSPETRGMNTLQVASLSRIKLFVRPEGLEPKPDLAPEQLRFSRSAGKLVIHNPTPYHITLVKLKDGAASLPNTMVAPKSEVSVDSSGSGAITFSTINDYGATTPVATGQMK
ncbi:fimbria/pilus periplasmic chaperone [Enterobacter kobei]|nr:fimbria/pilus periplasmic chaperone [Enterobacter kobei]HCM9500258.1 fimbria/pilus periplasmic chaperone [Enterobacter asburiae]